MEVFFGNTALLSILILFGDFATKLKLKRPSLVESPSSKIAELDPCLNCFGDTAKLVCYKQGNH